MNSKPASPLEVVVPLQGVTLILPEGGRIQVTMPSPWGIFVRSVEGTIAIRPVDGHNIELFDMEWSDE